MRRHSFVGVSAGSIVALLASLVLATGAAAAGGDHTQTLTQTSHGSNQTTGTNPCKWGHGRPRSGVEHRHARDVVPGW